MRRIAIIAAVATALSVADSADAQTLYKCVASNVTSYQQTPCPHNARLVRTMETTPEPAPTATQLAEQARKTRMDREESAFLSHLAGTDQVRTSSSGYRSGYRSSGRLWAQRDSQHDGCSAAKASRENALRAAGLNRSFDLLRRVDDDVAEACKHR